MRQQVPLAFLVLITASLACAGRVFQNTHVYALPQIPLLEAYDPTSDAILADNVWVFRPDGTFQARITSCKGHEQFSGSYSGDDVGSDFLFLLDTNGDGTTDDQVQLDVQDDAYSFIDWKCSEQPIRFWLLP